MGTDITRKCENTREMMEMRQGYSLQGKMHLSRERIMDWYENHDGKVYVAFSGGKDSTVLLHLVRSIYPDVPAVFSDTGLEYPEIKEFVKTWDNVVTVRPKMNFKNMLAKYGFPVVSKKQSRFIRDLQNPTPRNEATRNLRLTGMNRAGKYLPTMILSKKWRYLIDAPFKISEQCCDINKKNPMKKYEKETDRKPFIGTMVDDSSLRKQAWFRDGCNSFDGKRVSSKPLSFWTEENI